VSASETLGRFKRAYTTEGRAAAARVMGGLRRTRVTPNMLSAAGVLLCIAGSVLVYFEYEAWWLFLVGSVVFVVGSIVDVLDGALARATGSGTPFGAFLDSTLDRVGEGFMLGAIALVLMRDGRDWGVALTFAAVAGSFLVSYTRARAEALGLRGDVGLSSRVERVVIISVGLGFASLGSLPYVVAVLTATAWITVVQRILFVRVQLRERARAEATRPGA
jgi:CDP-diacylglycerol--glycerol-3-phosphate 3-phosphatidyltransferase